MNVSLFCFGSNFQNTLTNRNKQKQKILETTVLTIRVFQVMRFESILSQTCPLQLRKLVLFGAFVCSAGVSSLMFSCGI